MIHKDISLAGTATVGPKGQVVIPAEVREQMGIAPGSKLVVLYVKHKKSVAMVPVEQVQRLIDAMGEDLRGLQASLEDVK